MKPRPTWLVTPDFILNTQTQQIIDKPTTHEWNAIAQAIRLAKSFDMIGFIGEHGSINLGSNSLWDPRSAFWATMPLSNLHIVGLDETAKIRGTISFQDNIEGTISFQDNIEAPRRIRFSDYTHIVNDQRCIITYQHQGPFKGLAFDNIKFDVSPENFLGGVMANDWIFRFHGAAQFSINNCHQLHANKMHFVYADNVAGDSFVTNCTANAPGRTMVQIVNRLNSGASSKGNILVERCKVSNSGHLDGGSAFTVAGHLGGTVKFRNCHSIGGTNGGLVAWAETNNCHKNEDGKAIDHLVVEDCSFVAVDSDRDCMMISSCSNAELGNNQIAWNKTALRLDHQEDEENKAFSFTTKNPSKQRWSAPVRVIQGHDHNSSVTLTEEEIDELYKPREN